jgi:SAM-dependent methyltransferase
MNKNKQNSVTQIFNRKNIKYNFFQTSNLYIEIADEIAERIKETNLNYEYAVELNSKIINVGIQIEKTKLIKNLYRTGTNNYLEKNILNFKSDEEFLPLKSNSLNLVYSILGLNTVNDLPGTFKQIFNSLKKNGLFIGVFWGQGTLSPLAEGLAYADEKILGGLYQRIFPFCDIKTLGTLLQRAGFTMPIADQEKTIKKYSCIGDLLTDIKSFNEKNNLIARSKAFTPKSIFDEAEIYIKKNYSKNKCFSIPFNIIYVTGWKN